MMEYYKNLYRNRLLYGLRILVITLVIMCPLLLNNISVRADDKHSGVASKEEMAASVEVEQYGMLPIYSRDVVEGEYQIVVDTSSNFFHINNAVLSVKDRKMTASMAMRSHSYEVLYAGTAEDAAKAPASDYIYPKEDKEGNYVWTYDVEALDKGMPCAAYSKNKHKWYDRQILFNAGSLPEEALLVKVPDYHRIEWAMEELDKKQGVTDSGQGASKEAEDGNEAADTDIDSQGEDVSGEDELDRPAFIVTKPHETDRKNGVYSIEVNMTGGSGRASISSPTYYIVRDGYSYARLIWSSTYYDYMIVGGKKYLNETKDGGNSTFTIPISRMDVPVPVIADTTAMGDPVEIEYNLTFYQDTIGEKAMIPQEAAKKVLLIALIVIAVGGILNHLVKTKRKGR